MAEEKHTLRELDTEGDTYGKEFQTGGVHIYGGNLHMVGSYIGQELYEGGLDLHAG